MNNKNLVLGCQTFGKQISESNAFQILDYSLEHGIKKFDLAERYPFPESRNSVGLTEKIFGNWMNSRKTRDKVFLSTKVTGRNESGWFGKNGSRLTTERINEAIKRSIKRLNVDDVDLFFLHWPDRYTNNFGRNFYNPEPDFEYIPIEDQYLGLVKAQKEGLIKYYGVANESAWGVMKFIEQGRSKNNFPYLQEPFSLLDRKIEIYLSEIIMREKLQLQVHSIISGGLLSGKYKFDKNNLISGEGRLTRFLHETRKFKRRLIIDKYLKIENFCKDNNLSIVELAIIYPFSKKFISDVIIGVSSLEQLKMILKIVNNPLNFETVNELEKLIWSS